MLMLAIKAIHHPEPQLLLQPPMNEKKIHEVLDHLEQIFEEPNRAVQTTVAIPYGLLATIYN